MEGEREAEALHPEGERRSYSCAQNSVFLSSKACKTGSLCNLFIYSHKPRKHTSAHCRPIVFSATRSHHWAWNNSDVIVVTWSSGAWPGPQTWQPLSRYRCLKWSRIALVPVLDLDGFALTCTHGVFFPHEHRWWHFGLFGGHVVYPLCGSRMKSPSFCFCSNMKNKFILSQNMI